MHAVGGNLLEKLLNGGDKGYQGSWISCDCGGWARFLGYREKHIRTILGEIKVERAYYYCESCHRGQIPTDERLDIKGTCFSPGLRRLGCRVGAKESFQLGSEDLRELAGVDLLAKEVERISEKGDVIINVK